MNCSDDALFIHETSFIDGQFLGVMDTKMSKTGNRVTSVLEGMRWGRDVDDVVICD